MKAKEVIRNILHTVAVIVGFIAFFLLVGTAGAIDQNAVDDHTGFTRMFIFLAVFGACVLIGNACKGECDEEDIYR